MRKPETILRLKIKKALQEEYPDALFLKIHISPYQERGIPDLICCIQGRFIGLEVKRPGEIPTLYQESVSKRIWRARGKCFTVYSVKDALEKVHSVVVRHKK